MWARKSFALDCATDDIAKDYKISYPTPQDYFSSRNDIWQCLVNGLTDEDKREIEASEQSKEPNYHKRGKGGMSVESQALAKRRKILKQKIQRAFDRLGKSTYGKEQYLEGKKIDSFLNVNDDNSSDEDDDGVDESLDRPDEGAIITTPDTPVVQHTPMK